MGTTTEKSGRRAAVEAHLATLGLTASAAGSGIAHDATLTPETFARSGDLALAAAHESVGPLPRIALSGVVPERGAAVPPPASADLEILAVLGEGGMGRVHLARQRSLGRDVAVKTLKDEVADTRTVAMLRAEATTMGRLEHPNVVPVHAVGLDDGGRLLLVMKRIDGVSWRDLLRDPEHPRWATLAPDPSARLDAHLDVLVQVCNALHFAHDSGVVHRDVKPDNVLLGAHGEVYLADWGVALRAGGLDGPKTELVGTPAYMAPEMVVGDRTRIDRRTDVFLLGATLFEVLTGAPPHDGPTLHATLLCAFEAAPPRFAPDVPTELAAIATRAMAPRPEDRFPSALAFRQAIDETRRHRGSIALTRVGRALLSELEPRLGREAPGATDASLDRQLTECRFALVSALRDWPENAEAREALDACLRLTIGHELARENAGAAEALVAELSTPDPELSARIAALGRALEARRHEAERLRAIEADQDLSSGFGARAAMVGVLLLVSTAISIGVTWRTRTEGAFAGSEIVMIGSAVLLTVLVPLVIFRRRLLANAVGRRVSAMLVIACGATVLHRIVGVRLGVGTDVILCMDLAVIAGVTAAAGAVLPRVAWAALLPAAAAIAAPSAPSMAAPIFSVTTIVTIGVVSVIWFLEMRAKATGGAGRSPPSSAKP